MVTVLATVNTWVKVDRAVTPSSRTTGSTAVLGLNLNCENSQTS